MTAADRQFLRLALRLARKGQGCTSPNPMVGAVLVRGGKILGRGWHRRAGQPHAEIEALLDAQKRGHRVQGATLYVTLEPCCTHGRTPPCTSAIITAGIKRVVIGTTDPNPHHAGRGFELLRKAGIEVVASGSLAPLGERARVRGTASRKASTPPSDSANQKLAAECAQLNAPFNHWIVHRTPLVTVKAAMTLDGKIATASGESKWITGPAARDQGMQLRAASDAILVGINTVLADDPSLTVRQKATPTRDSGQAGKGQKPNTLRRIILDSKARTPLTAKVVTDEFAALTTIVVSPRAPKARVAALAQRVNVLVAPAKKNSKLNTKHSTLALRWLLKQLGSQNVTSLLVEGGGEVNASFLMGGHAQRVAFFYAPKILGGRDSRKAVAGEGAKNLSEVLTLADLKWQRLGDDLLLTAKVESTS